VGAVSRLLCVHPNDTTSQWAESAALRDCDLAYVWLSPTFGRSLSSDQACSLASCSLTSPRSAPYLDDHAAHHRAAPRLPLGADLSWAVSEQYARPCCPLRCSGECRALVRGRILKKGAKCDVDFSPFPSSIARPFGCCNHQRPCCCHFSDPIGYRRLRLLVQPLPRITEIPAASVRRGGTLDCPRTSRW